MSDALILLAAVVVVCAVAMVFVVRGAYDHMRLRGILWWAEFDRRHPASWAESDLRPLIVATDRAVKALVAMQFGLVSVREASAAFSEAFTRIAPESATSSILSASDAGSGTNTSSTNSEGSEGRTASGVLSCGPGCCTGCGDCFGEAIGCHADPSTCAAPEGKN